MPDGTYGGTSALDEAIAAYFEGQDLPRHLDTRQRGTFETLLPWLDMLRALSAETAAERSSQPADVASPKDPIAAMLGLVPDPSVRVDPARLRSARTRAGLDVGQLVARLRAREWRISTGEAARWERAATAIPPALLVALAEELGQEPATLTSGRSTGSEFAVLLDDERISSYLDEWAREVSLDRGTLRDHVSAVLAGAGRRGASTSTSVDTLLAILHTLRSVPGFVAGR